MSAKGHHDAKSAIKTVEFAAEEEVHPSVNKDEKENEDE